MEYVILAPISPDSGPIIHPAPPGEPPVIVTDETLFGAPSELFTTEERAKILTDRGIIKAATARQSAKAKETDNQPDTKES